MGMMPNSSLTKPRSQAFFRERGFGKTLKPAFLQELVGDHIKSGWRAATPARLTRLLNGSRVDVLPKEALWIVSEGSRLLECHDRPGAKGKGLLLRWKRKFMRQSIEPVGTTKIWSPPPSARLLDFCCGSKLSISESVSGMAGSQCSDGQSLKLTKSSPRRAIAGVSKN